MSLVVDPMRLGVAAEFAEPGALLAAIRRLRELGYERLDAYTPYPVPGLEEAIPVRRTRLPWLALAAGLAGALTGYLVQWYCNAYDFPINVGGRPLHSAPAFLVIAFETGVLFASVAVFFGIWIGGRLPEPWTPLSDLPGFERATVDRFWLAVDARDPRFDDPLREGREGGETGLERLLRRAGALRVVRPERVEPSAEPPPVRRPEGVS